jgi:hypothetical protein
VVKIGNMHPLTYQCLRSLLADAGGIEYALSQCIGLPNRHILVTGKSSRIFSDN